MDSRRRTRELIELFLDVHEPVEGRDDAAILLSESNAPETHSALLKVGSDAREDELLQARAGEILAMIWLRHGNFQRDVLERLTPLARAEAEGLISRQRPEWLT